MKDKLAEFLLSECASMVQEGRFRWVTQDCSGSWRAYTSEPYLHSHPDEPYWESQVADAECISLRGFGHMCLNWKIAKFNIETLIAEYRKDQKANRHAQVIATLSAENEELALAITHLEAAITIMGFGLPADNMRDKARKLKEERATYESMIEDLKRYSK